VVDEAVVVVDNQDPGHGETLIDSNCWPPPRSAPPSQARSMLTRPAANSLRSSLASSVDAHSPRCQLAPLLPRKLGRCSLAPLPTRSAPPSQARSMLTRPA